MRTPRELYHMTPIVYSCELDVCPTCGTAMMVAYVSKAETVQTMAGQVRVSHRPKQCSDPSCARHEIICKSAGWQPLAPCHCTYGYDVIAQIGWQRQTGRPVHSPERGAGVAGQGFSGNGGDEYTDAFALATAESLGATLTTGDPELLHLAGQVTIEKLERNR